MVYGSKATEASEVKVGFRTQPYWIAPRNVFFSLTAPLRRSSRLYILSLFIQGAPEEPTNLLVRGLSQSKNVRIYITVTFFNFFTFYPKMTFKDTNGKQVIVSMKLCFYLGGMF